MAGEGIAGAAKGLASWPSEAYGAAMGFAELFLVLVLVLLFFGARKLPAIGEGLGKAVRGFKDATRTGAPPAPRAEKGRLPPGPEGR